MTQENLTVNKSLKVSKKEILDDFLLMNVSRNISYIGRKEVFMGRAKFGVFGDGKELPQIAMSKFFRNGDFRSGYYRDQTFMMSINQLTPDQFFAQLYAHTDIKKDPHSGGRQMNCHFGTRLLNENGDWKTQTDMMNSVSDISCVSGQMPRIVGLAYASKLYRNNKNLSDMENFSINGNEVVFGTIGDASTSEGHFGKQLMRVVSCKFHLLCQYGMMDTEFLSHLNIILQEMICLKLFQVFKDHLKKKMDMKFLQFMLGTTLIY